MVRSTPSSRATRRALGTARTLPSAVLTRAGWAAPLLAGAAAAAATGAAAGAEAAAGAAAPAPVTRWKITSPTGTVTPSSTRRLEMVPAAGAGTSTVALSVITSTTGWCSSTEAPSSTSHWTISPSAMPSPISGSLNSMVLPPAAAAGAAASAGASAGAAAGAPAAPSSRWKITLPTGTVSPSPARCLTTVPAAGAGTSTVALSVITSTTGWCSSTAVPSATSHWTISPSAMPSPISGSLNSIIELGGGSAVCLAVEAEAQKS